MKMTSWEAEMFVQCQLDHFCQRGLRVVPLGPLYHCYRLWGSAANTSAML